MANVVADIFRQAADLNRRDARREGNLVRLEEQAQVLVAGDIHGSRLNFGKIVGYAALGAKPDRRLVLQEIIHGPVEAGHDRSAELLLRAARLKVAQEREVLFIMGNHDLAQATGNEIAKEGAGVCKQFADGVRFAFPRDADEILAAIDEFLLSMPLAVQTPGGTFVAHSLPSPSRAALAGTEILVRAAQQADLNRGGAIYEWTWGRNHDEAMLEDFIGRLGASYFVLGHKHVDAWERLSPLAMVLNSDGERGCVLEFAADARLDDRNIETHVKRILALGT